MNDLDVINDCRFDLIQQTYLFNEVNKSLRIRVKNEFAFLTIKGNQVGITRDEFEYEITKNKAIEMIEQLHV